jgi:LemA protein
LSSKESEIVFDATVNLAGRLSGVFAERHDRRRQASRAASLRIPIFVTLLGVLLSGCGVNNIPSFEEKSKASWSDVQNQYQRRADLIPNLVETVKGYATQEREVLTQVTEARAKASQIKVDASTVTDPAKFKEYQDAQNALSGALGRLLVTVERYPDLKSNQNFLALQSQLEGTENRIAVARRDYIESVRAYNTELKTFPGVIWASTLYRSYKPMETFTATAEADRPPTVKF